MFINESTGTDIQFVDETIDRIPLVDNASFGVDVGDVDLDSDIDIVVANDGSSPGVDGQPNQLLLNDGEGYFVDVANFEFPSTNNTPSRDVRLFDVDNDGDLDLVVANLAELLSGATIRGVQNQMWINNKVGSNFNAVRYASIRNLGIPAVFYVNPSSGGIGTQNMNVDIIGINFVPGATVDFGSDITVNEAIVKLPNKIAGKITISPTASLGPRTVTVTNPNGDYGFKPAAFRVTTERTTFVEEPLWFLYK